MIEINKKKTMLGTLLSSTIGGLIPGVIINIGGSCINKNFTLDNTAYEQFIIAILIINAYFCIILGILAVCSKALYKILYGITTIAVLGLVAYSYIKFKEGDALLLHLACAALFELRIYVSAEGYLNSDPDYTSNNNSSDSMDSSSAVSKDSNSSNNGSTPFTNYDLRMLTPFIISFVGLVTIYWFIMKANMNIIVHVVIVSILNIIFLSNIIKHFINFKKAGLINIVTSNYVLTHDEMLERIRHKEYMNNILKETERRLKNKNK